MAQILRFSQTKRKQFDLCSLADQVSPNVKVGFELQYECSTSAQEFYLFFQCGFMSCWKRGVYLRADSQAILLAVHEGTRRQSSTVVEGVLVSEALHSFHFLRLRVLGVEPSPNSYTHAGIHDLRCTKT